MKALVVAETQSAIDSISRVLEKAGYDVIVYRWLLKAMDNIAEISPHLVIISAPDYPRHWKILTQYVQTSLSDNPPNVILHTSDNFDCKEILKAAALKIRGVFDSSEDGLENFGILLETIGKSHSEPHFETDDSVEAKAETRAVVVSESAEEIVDSDDAEITTTVSKPVAKSETFDIVPSDNESVGEPPLEQDADSAQNDAESERIRIEEDSMAQIENQSAGGMPETVPCSFVFTNPVTLAMVSGVPRNFNGSTLEFTPDIPSFINNLSAGTRIDSATLKANEKIESVRAEVVSADEEKLVLKIEK